MAVDSSEGKTNPKLGLDFLNQQRATRQALGFPKWPRAALIEGN